MYRIYNVFQIVECSALTGCAALFEGQRAAHSWLADLSVECRRLIYIIVVVSGPVCGMLSSYLHYCCG